MQTPPDLAVVARQERELVFSAFDAGTAWDLGCRLRERALARGAALAIDVRRFGQVLFFVALPGAAPNNAEWVRRKSNVVAYFLRSSYGVGLSLLESGATLAGKYGLADADHAAHGGSFPITVASAGVTGAVTVSGLPQREDHEFVVETLCEALGRDYAVLAFPPAAGESKGAR